MAVAGRSSGRSQDIAFGAIANDLQRAAFQFGAMAGAAQQLFQSLAVFRELNKQLTLTNAIANGTRQNFEAMNEAVRDFALGTTFTAAQSANALLFLAQAGFTTEQSLNAMTGVLTLAQGSLENVNETADLVASTITAFSLEAGDASDIANLFAASMSQSLATLPKLAYALRQVGPVAGSMGVSIEDTTAALSELFDVGLRGEQAGTALRNVMIGLVNPVGEAGKIIDTLNLQIYRADGTMRDFFDILKDLSRFNLSDSDLVTLFGREALAGGVALLESARTGNLDAVRESISGTQEATRIALEQMNSFDSRVRQAQNAVDEFRISLGEQLAPTISQFILGPVTDLAIGWREMDEATKASIVTLAEWSTVLIAGGSAGALVVQGLGGLIGILGRTAATFARSASEASIFFSMIGNAGPRNTRTATTAIQALWEGIRAGGPAVGIATAAILGVGGLVFAMNQAAEAAKQTNFEGFFGDLEEYAGSLSRRFSNFRQMNASNSGTLDYFGSLAEELRTAQIIIEEQLANEEAFLRQANTLMDIREDVLSRMTDTQFRQIGADVQSTKTIYPLVDFLQLAPDAGYDDLVEGFTNYIRTQGEKVRADIEKLNPALAAQFEEDFNASLSDFGDEIERMNFDMIGDLPLLVIEKALDETLRGDTLQGLQERFKEYAARAREDADRLGVELASQIERVNVEGLVTGVVKEVEGGLTSDLKSALSAAIREAATGGQLEAIIRDILGDASVEDVSERIAALPELLRQMLIDQGIATASELSSADTAKVQQAYALVLKDALADIDKAAKDAATDVARSELKIAEANDDLSATMALREIARYEALADDILQTSATVNNAIADRMDSYNVPPEAQKVLTGAFLAEMIMGTPEQREQALRAINDAEAYQQLIHDRVRSIYGLVNFEAALAEAGVLVPEVAEVTNQLYAPIDALVQGIQAGDTVRSTADRVIAELAAYLEANAEVAEALAKAANIPIENLNSAEVAQLSAEAIFNLNAGPAVALAAEEVRREVIKVLLSNAGFLDKVTAGIKLIREQAANLVTLANSPLGESGDAAKALEDEMLGGVQERIRSIYADLTAKQANLAEAANIRDAASAAGGGGGKSAEQQLADLENFLADRNRAIIDANIELAAFGEDFNLDEYVRLRIQEVDAEYTARITDAKAAYEDMFASVSKGTEDYARLVEMRDRELTQLERLREANLEYAHSAEFAAAAQREAAQAVLDKYIEMNTHTGSFFEGLVAGAQSWVYDLKTEFQVGMDSVKTIIDGLVGFGTGMFNDFFTEVATGQKTMGEALQENLSKMLLSWANYFAELALKYFADWALRQIFGLVGGALSGGTMGAFGVSAATPLGFGGTSGIYGIPNSKGGVTSSPGYFAYRDGSLGTYSESGQVEGILPLERDSRGRLGVIAVAGKEPSQQGNLLQYSNHLSIDLGNGNVSQENNVALMERMDTQMKETALRVIGEERRPGGLLWGNS